MQVAIAGGHGKIALLLAEVLAERGDRARSLVRSRAQFDDVSGAGGEPVEADLEADEPAALAEALAGCDAVVFAAGAGPGSGPARKETVDYGGAVKLAEAARLAGIERYVMISSVGADPDAEGDEGFAVYLRAKGRADRDVMASGLDVTVVRPVGLTDDPGTGTVDLASGADGTVGSDTVARADVAATLAAVLADPATIGATLVVSSGDKPVADALAEVTASR